MSDFDFAAEWRLTTAKYCKNVKVLSNRVVCEHYEAGWKEEDDAPLSLSEWCIMHLIISPDGKTRSVKRYVEGFIKDTCDKWVLQEETHICRLSCKHHSVAWDGRGLSLQRTEGLEEWLNHMGKALAAWCNVHDAIKRGEDENSIIELKRYIDVICAGGPF